MTYTVHITTESGETVELLVTPSDAGLGVVAVRGAEYLTVSETETCG